jgi:DNA-binding LacI/PurR family transcriptional regulator
MSDRLARGALEGARIGGFSVPGDLSVIGFDDDPEAERTAPPLTTVRQPHVEKGRAAAELLIARLEGRESASTILFPTELVLRGSTAPPPADTAAAAAPPVARRDGAVPSHPAGHDLR